VTARPPTVALPQPGELWQSDAPHYLTVHVLGVDLAAVPPVVEYEVLDDHGASLSGPLRLTLDATWHATFSRRADGAAA
jgi:hypothetical protein